MTDADGLRLAYLAATKSPDPSTQNGAVLFPVRGPRVEGWTSNLYPVSDHTLNDKDEKYKHVEHAERNVIFKAAKLGVCTDGATMYCPWAPCIECARAIIGSGIVRLVTHDAPWHARNDHWVANVEVARQMLSRGGVQLDRISYALDAGITIRFKGERVEV